MFVYFIKKISLYIVYKYIKVYVGMNYCTIITSNKEGIK